MGGVIDWNALELLAATHGVEDITILVDQLVTIRDFMKMVDDAK